MPHLVLDSSFAFGLLLKMGFAGLIAVSVTVAAEKAGPVIGGLLATLPITSGPAYFFLAQNHDAAFIAQTALSTFSQNIPTAIFATCYTLLARRMSTLTSTGSSLGVWVTYLLLSLWADRSFPTALALGACVFPLCIILVRPYLHVTAPAGRQHAGDLIMRGIIVGGLVGAIEIASLVAGARWTGVLAAAPVFYLCLMVILHRRLGGRAAGAVIANTIAGFTGTSFAFLVIYALAVPCGKWLALLVGLIFSVSWNLGLYLLHIHGDRISQLALRPFPLAQANRRPS